MTARSILFQPTSARDGADDRTDRGSPLVPA